MGWRMDQVGEWLSGWEERAKVEEWARGVTEVGCEDLV